MNEQDIKEIEDSELLQPPKDLLQKVQKRHENWLIAKQEVFPDSQERFKQIRKSLTTGTISAKDINEIIDDMSWLAAYYDFIVELEGIVFAKRRLAERFFEDNVFYLKAKDLVHSNNNNECKALAVRMFPSSLAKLYGAIVNNEFEMCILGIEKDRNTTSRSASLKLIIEVYKKRHDALLETINTRGGKRFD